MTYSERFRCDDCGAHHWLDTSLPNEVWSQIAKPEEVLCTQCIDRRAVAKGITFEAEFYWFGQAGHSRLYSWRHEREPWHIWLPLVLVPMLALAWWIAFATGTAYAWSWIGHGGPPWWIFPVNVGSLLLACYFTVWWRNLDCDADRAARSQA